MSTRSLTLLLSATVPQEVGGGRFFFIKSATAAILIEARRRDGQPIVFENVGAGLQFPTGQNDSSISWTSLKITSATSQTVEMVISDEGQVGFGNVATLAGTSPISEQPSSATLGSGDVNINNATTNTTAVPANLLRKRISIGALSANTGSLRIRDAANNAACELQPGTEKEFKTTAALQVRNDSGATQTFYTFEET